jgi:hypothetical protein
MESLLAALGACFLEGFDSLKNGYVTKRQAEKDLYLIF